VLKTDMDASFREMQWAWSIIPRVLVIATVGLWGRLMDRSNPLTLRGGMNLTWAVMPLLVFLAPPFLPLPVDPLWFAYAGRLIQGAVIGGSGLIWHLGVMYFARKEDVPAYMSVHIGMTGLRATVAPWAGPLLVRWLGGEGGGAAAADARAMMFLVVALLMVYAGTLMLRMARRIRKEHGGTIPSFTEQEEAEEGRNPTAGNAEGQ
jgi:hypothetical protein